MFQKFLNEVFLLMFPNMFAKSLNLHRFSGSMHIRSSQVYKFWMQSRTDIN
jgi:hypothetical protein